MNCRDKACLVCTICQLKKNDNYIINYMVRRHISINCCLDNEFVHNQRQNDRRIERS